MTAEERNNKLKHFITCLKCEISGKCCDDDCSTQYDAGNMGEIIANLEEISKILEQESTTKNDLGVDCISRIETIDYLCKHCPDDGECFKDCDEIKHLRQMPSVTPQPKTGHWIRQKDLYGHANTYECSECGRVIAPYDPDDIEELEDYPYCHCGCRMVGPSERSDED